MALFRALAGVQADECNVSTCHRAQLKCNWCSHRSAVLGHRQKYCQIYALTYDEYLAEHEKRANDEKSRVQ